MSLHSPWECPCSPCCPCNSGWCCLTPDGLTSKGGVLMTAIPQMECCTMLGIDPKTLRNWLRHAHLHFVAHPTDARLKCLTLGASPAVGYPACSPHRATCRRFSGAPARSHPTCLRRFRPLASLNKTRLRWLTPLPLSRKKQDSERLCAVWRRK